MTDNQDSIFKVKVLKCSNFMLWYKDHVGEEFDVVREEKTAWWVREKERPHPINWIYKTDSEII